MKAVYALALLVFLATIAAGNDDELEQFCLYVCATVPEPIDKCDDWCSDCASVPKQTEKTPFLDQCMSKYCKKYIMYIWEHYDTDCHLLCELCNAMNSHL